MTKLLMELPGDQAERLANQLVAQLAPSAKLRLAERLARETRLARWEPLVVKMRQRFARHPLSVREIRQLCETVRQERYQRAHRR